MEIHKVRAGSIVLFLTSEEASKLYNLTCFVNRVSRRKQLDYLVGDGTTQMNTTLQRVLFSQGVKPDYEKEVQS